MKKGAFPLKKTFVQDFYDTRGRTLLTIRYEQATILEYYEFINKTYTDQVAEIHEIIKPLFAKKWWQKIIYFFNRNYKTKIEIGADINGLILSVIQNRYRGYESIFTEVKKKIGGKPSNIKGSIDAVGLLAICKNYKMSPTDLLNNYTLEQYLWFLDGIEWYNNSQTKKGQAINNMAIIDKEAVKKRAEINKKQFEKFKNN